MAETAVMTEKEAKIMQTFGKVIPKLTENQKNYLLGLGEGMDIAKSGSEPNSMTLAAGQAGKSAIQSSKSWGK